MPRVLSHTLFAVVLMLLSGSAFSFALTPANSTVDIGDEIRFSLTGDYADFRSFDLNISYDSTVLMPVYDGFEPFLDNVDDIGAGADLSGNDDLFSYLFSDSVGPGLFGLSFSADELETGSGEIAFFTFKAIAAGISTISLNGIADPNLGCDETIDSCLTEEVVSQNSQQRVQVDRPIVARAEVTVLPGQSSPVPLPGVLYLMITGLVAGALARRRSQSP